MKGAAVGAARRARKSGREGPSSFRSIRSEIVLPTLRRLVLDGVRECAGIGRAGEPCGIPSSMEGLGGGKRHEELGDAESERDSVEDCLDMC